jgi:hypothetical protein
MVAGVLVTPGTRRVIAQDGASDGVVEDERARPQVCLGQRPAWIDAGVPDGAGALDAKDVVCGVLAALALGVDRGAIEFFHLRGRDAPVLAVARLPCRQAEPLPDVILTGLPIIAGMRVDEEVVAGQEPHGEGAVLGRMSRPRRGNRVAPDHVAAEGTSCGANVDQGRLRRRA